MVGCLSLKYTEQEQKQIEQMKKTKKNNTQTNN